MRGAGRTRASNVWRILRLGSFASSTEWQWPHNTVTVRSPAATVSGEERDAGLRLRIGQPAIRAVVEADMPLVPAALLPLVHDPSDDLERLLVIPSGRAELDGRARRRQVGHRTDLLEVHVLPHQNRATERAHSLHRARPAELDPGAAVRAGRLRSGHAPRAGSV